MSKKTRKHFQKSFIFLKKKQNIYFACFYNVILLVLKYFQSQAKGQSLIHQLFEMDHEQLNNFRNNSVYRRKNGSVGSYSNGSYSNISSRNNSYGSHNIETIHQRSYSGETHVINTKSNSFCQTMEVSNNVSNMDFCQVRIYISVNSYE